MKKFARVILWLAFALILVQMGSLSGAHHGTAIADLIHYSDIFTCKANQTVLQKVDRVSWTDEQRSALDSICDFSSFWREESASNFRSFLTIGLLLLVGSLLYILAKIRQAWKARRIE